MFRHPRTFSLRAKNNFSSLYTIRETNFSVEKCVLAKPIDEQRTAFYTLFVYSSFVSDKNCFAASWRIFLLSFVKKLPHWRNGNETRGEKLIRRNDEQLSTHYSRFAYFLLVFCRYSRIVYSALLSSSWRPFAWQNKTNHISKMLWVTFYTLFVLRTNFVVSSMFHCGSRIVCSSPQKYYKVRTKVLFSKFHDQNEFFFNFKTIDNYIFIHSGFGCSWGWHGESDSQEW